MATRISVLVLQIALLPEATFAAEEKEAKLAFVVDKEAKTITIPARIAPRKLPALSEVYPIEVVATGKSEAKAEKAHETIVTVDVKPSDIHKALEGLGLKPGKPAGANQPKAEGPELKISLELPNKKTVPIEKTLVDKKTGKPMPTIKWHFTGSALKKLDPTKNEETYGADATLTLIGIFPVTPFTVIQSNLTMEDEPLIKMETNKTILPTEGTEVKLIIAVASK